MGGRVASPTFVGRVEELRILEAVRVRAANGEPAVVLLGGEAAVGKTRLVTELAARCGADGTRLLSSRCVPVSEGGLPFAPTVAATWPSWTAAGRSSASSCPAWTGPQRWLSLSGSSGRHHPTTW